MYVVSMNRHIRIVMIIVREKSFYKISGSYRPFLSRIDVGY